MAAHKPVVTGVGEPPGDWPADHECVAAAAGARPDEVCSRTFEPAVSPHLAAELAGVALDFDELGRTARAAAAGADAVVVEGVGGLLVPLNATHDVRDLAVALGLPLSSRRAPGLARSTTRC